MGTCRWSRSCERLIQQLLDLLVSVLRLGRTKTLLGALTLAVVSGVLVCVSPNPTVFIITRFFLAAAGSGVYLALYVAREFLPSQQTAPPPPTSDPPDL